MNNFIDITDKQKDDYNKIISHPLQSFEWGEFRKKTNTKVIRRALIKKDKIIDGFTLTIHKIPFLPYNIGYLPKGNLPTKEILNELYRIGQEEKCVYIQVEPNVTRNQELGIRNQDENSGKLKPLIHNSSHSTGFHSDDMSSERAGQAFIIHHSFHPLFTRYTFLLDLTKSEDELLKAMHPKTRYNIKVAQKHGVEIVEDNSDEAFGTYLKLTNETTQRQKFYAHDENYHRKMWEVLKSPTTNSQRLTTNDLTAHLILAKYRPALRLRSGQAISDQKPTTLVTWIVFVFKNTLYYPYGASSTQHRETMASNLIMWEVIRFGKRLGLKHFDMWGALGPNPDKNDPWYGFHRFKEGYGGELVEFVASYDLVVNPTLYRILEIADKMRWAILRLKK